MSKLKCNEDCFNCKYEDCIAPSHLLKTEPHVRDLFKLSQEEKTQRRALFDYEYNRTKRKKKKKEDA